MSEDSKQENRSQSEPRDPRRKYLNQTQLVQGVAQINEPLLDQAERLMLQTLAAFQVNTFPNPANYPHPGNKILMNACCVTTRQGVNAIAERLTKKKLAVVWEVGNGRGKATVYRLCTEDPRFPWPKPATPELPLPEKEPATGTQEPATLELPVSPTENGNPQLENGNPQLDPAKPATVELHTDVDSDLPPCTSKTKTKAKPAAPVSEIVLPEWLPKLQWDEFLKMRKTAKKPLTPYAQKIAIQQLDKLRLAGHDLIEVMDHTIVAGYPEFYEPRSTASRGFGPRTTEDHREQMRKNAKALGFCLETGLPVEHCTCPVHIQSRQYVTSEFGPRRKRSPAVQAEIEAIAKEFLEEN